MPRRSQRLRIGVATAIGAATLFTAAPLAGATTSALDQSAQGSAEQKTGWGHDMVAYSAGNQETPPNGSAAWAWSVFDLSDDGMTLTYSARVFGLEDPSAAHLHLGAAGVAGPVVVPLETPGAPGDKDCAATTGGTRPGHDPSMMGTRCDFSDIAGTIEAADLTGPLAGKPLKDLVEAAAGGRVYINFHSDAFPNGEVRGQLVS